MIEKWYYKDYKENRDNLIKNPENKWYIVDNPDNVILVTPGKDELKSEIEPPCVLFDFGRKMGGTILAFPGDIDLCYFGKGKENIHKIKNELNNLIINHLKFKGLNVVMSGNDILLDEFKIAGTIISRLVDDYYLYGIHISINVDLDMIKKYCSKPMRKIPKGLSEFDITNEELLKIIEDYSNSYIENDYRRIRKNEFNRNKK